MADNELWKPIVGYEGLYEVSNLGRVRSLPHKVQAWFGTRISPSKILSLHTNKATGYFSVCLCKDNKKRNHLVHRLVAEAFVVNSNFLPQVNHKNEIKADNRAENLEWCNSAYNNNYGTRNSRVGEKNKVSKCKTVAQIKNGEIVAVFPSTISAKHIADPGHIGKCCNGIRKSAGGFQWIYV